jgi:hypothetical protein
LRYGSHSRHPASRMDGRQGGIGSGRLPSLNRKALATSRICRHIWRMADGYVVEVTNPFAAPGEPVKQIWFAHIHDKEAGDQSRQEGRWSHEACFGRCRSD